MKSEKLLIFNSGNLLIIKNINGVRLPSPEEYAAAVPCEDCIFRFGSYSAFELPSDSLTDDMRFVGLRESATLLSDEDYAAAAKGAELLFWNKNTRNCGRCGALLERASAISKRCPKCNSEIFPQLSPAILVLVKRGDKALLVHARNFTRPFFGLVAGFVETGESLEECVRREVREECSLEIDNIRYFGSQTWPFPANLMIGFTADYLSGDLTFADNELSAGGFFSRSDHPSIPSPPSLARTIIRAWLDGEI